MDYQQNQDYKQYVQEHQGIKSRLQLGIISIYWIISNTWILSVHIDLGKKDPFLQQMLSSFPSSQSFLLMLCQGGLALDLWTVWGASNQKKGKTSVDRMGTELGELWMKQNPGDEICASLDTVCEMLFISVKIISLGVNIKKKG